MMFILLIGPFEVDHGLLECFPVYEIWKYTWRIPIFYMGPYLSEKNHFGLVICHMPELYANFLLESVTWSQSNLDMPTKNFFHFDINLKDLKKFLVALV